VGEGGKRARVCRHTEKKGGKASRKKKGRKKREAHAIGVEKGGGIIYPLEREKREKKLRKRKSRCAAPHRRKRERPLFSLGKKRGLKTGRLFPLDRKKKKGLPSSPPGTKKKD